MRKGSLGYRENIEEKQKVEIVLHRLGAAYGHLFMSESPGDGMFDLKVAEWQMSIGRYSHTKLHKAIERCKQEYKETVTLPQFMTCLNISQYQAMLDSDETPKLETSKEKSERIAKGKIALNKIRSLIR